MREAQKGNLEKLDKVTVATIQSSKYDIYSPLLSNQMFMYQEELKGVFMLFLPQLKHKLFCLLDQELRKSTFYFAPMLDNVACFSEEASTCNLDASHIDKVAVYKEKLPNTHIFRVSEPNTIVVLVSTMVAECILRRNIEGLYFSPVTQVKGKDKNAK